MQKQTQKIILWLITIAVLCGSSPLPALADTVGEFSTNYSLKRVGAGWRGDDYPGRFLVYSEGQVTLSEKSQQALTGEAAVPHEAGELQDYLGTHKKYGHTATTLRDGRVLIAGGIESKGRATSHAFIYTPEDEFVTPTDNMRLPRAFHTATLLPDGNVLLLGGEIVTDSPIPFKAVWGLGLLHENTYTGEVFMVKERKFVWLKDYFKNTGVYDGDDIRSGYLANMFTGRKGHQAVLVPGTDKVLILGGETESFWSHDPEQPDSTMTQHFSGAAPSYNFLQQKTTGDGIIEVETSVSPRTIGVGERAALRVKVSTPEVEGLAPPARAHMTLTIQGGGRFLRLTSGTFVEQDLSNVEQRDILGRTYQVEATLYPSYPFSYTYYIGIAGDEDFEFRNAIGIDVQISWGNRTVRTMEFVKRRGGTTSSTPDTNVINIDGNTFGAPLSQDAPTSVRPTNGNSNTSTSPDVLTKLRELYNYARFSFTRPPGAYSGVKLGGWLFSVTYDKQQIYLPNFSTDERSDSGKIQPTNFLGSIKERIIKAIADWRGSPGYLSQSYYLQDGEILNLTTGRFEPLSEPISTDANLVAVPLTDGQVLLTGGQLTSVVIYDGFKDTFTAQGELRYPRGQGMVPLIQYDNKNQPQKVYLVGGEFYSRVDELDWFFFIQHLKQEEHLSNADIGAIIGRPATILEWLSISNIDRKIVSEWRDDNIAPFDIYNVVTGQMEKVDTPAVVGPLHDDFKETLENKLDKTLSDQETQDVATKKGLSLWDRLTRIGLFSYANTLLDAYSAAATPFQSTLTTSTRWEKNQYILTSPNNGMFVYDLDENTWEPLSIFQWTATARKAGIFKEEKAGVKVATIKVDHNGNPLPDWLLNPYAARYNQLSGKTDQYFSQNGYCEVPALSDQPVPVYATATRLEDGILFLGGRGKLYGATDPSIWVGAPTGPDGLPIDLDADIAGGSSLAVIQAMISNPAVFLGLPLFTGVWGAFFGASAFMQGFLDTMAASKINQQEANDYIDEFSGDTANILIPYFDSLYDAWKFTKSTDVKRGDKMACISGNDYTPPSAGIGQPATPSGQQPGANNEILSDKIAPLNSVKADSYGNKILISASANSIPTDGTPVYIDAKVVDSSGQAFIKPITLREAETYPNSSVIVNPALVINPPTTFSVWSSRIERTQSDPADPWSGPVKKQNLYIYVSADEYETIYKPKITKIINDLKVIVPKYGLPSDATPLVTGGTNGQYAVPGLLIFQQNPDGTYSQQHNLPLVVGSAKYAVVYLGGRPNRFESISINGATGSAVSPASQISLYYADQTSADTRPKTSEQLSSGYAAEGTNLYGSGSLVFSQTRMPTSSAKSLHVTLSLATESAKRSAKLGWPKLPPVQLGLNLNPTSVRISQNGKVTSATSGGTDNIYNRSYFDLVWSGTADDAKVEFNVVYLGGRTDRFVSFAISKNYSYPGNVPGVNIQKSLYFDDQEYFINSLSDMVKEGLNKI